MTTPTWRFELLGRLRARRGDTELANVSVRRIGALIACLVIRGPAPIPRDEILSLLWPDDAVDAARNRLRVLLANLKQHLDSGDSGPSILIANRSTVGFAVGSFSSDYAEFQQHIANVAKQHNQLESLEAAMSLYRGDLLEGLADEWIVTERRRLSEIHYQMLQDLVSQLKASGALDKAAEYARQAVTAEPLDEEAHADLIELYGKLGRPSAGLRQFDQLKRLLQTELNAKPSARTRDIADRLTAQLGHGVGERRRAVRPVSPDEQAQPTAAPNSLPPLPMQLTGFFGRTIEVVALSKLLDPDSHSRLISVVGPGGAGKTRLALHMARKLSADYCGRVYFAQLAEIADASGVIPAIERSVGLPPGKESDQISRVAGVLGRGPALLVLDNLEQLVPQISSLVASLLTEAPGLRCLTTTRRSLGVEGEREFHLGPLPVPTGAFTALALRADPVVAMFLDRACAVSPTFADSDDAVMDAAAICEALEGLPLSIELAAARARSMASSEIKRHTAKLLDLLVDERGSRSGRHRSLRATVEWSWRLLDSIEQLVFEGVSLFSGGASRIALMHVVFDPGTSTVTADRVLERLCEASMMSLLPPEHGQVHTDRFVMLETIREFGLDKLTASDRNHSVRARHFDYFAGEFWRGFGESESAAVNRHDDIAADEANIRLALEFGLRQDADKETHRACLNLIDNMCPYWESQGRWLEGASYLERALELVDSSIESDIQMRLVLWQSKLASLLGQYDHAEKCAEAALEIAGHLASATEQAVAHGCAGMAAFCRGRYAESERRYEMAHQLYVLSGCRSGAAGSMASLANVAFYLGRDQEAIRRFQEALAVYRQIGDRAGSASVLHKLGNAWRQQGDLKQGERDLKEALDSYRAAGNRHGIASATHDLGLLISHKGDHAGAQDRYDLALEMFRAIGYRRGEAVCLYNLAALSTNMSDVETARAHLRESVALSRRIDERRNLAACMCLLGVLARLDGHLAEAREQYLAALEIEQEIASQGGISNCLTGLGSVAIAAGDTEEASNMLRRSLAITVGIGVPGGIALIMELFADILHMQDRDVQAARLLGKAASIRHEFGLVPIGHYSEHTKRTVEMVQNKLGETTYQCESSIGMALSTTDACAIVYG